MFGDWIMDDLIEILLELVLEGSYELLKSKKIPKWIRYIIALFFVSMILVLVVIGMLLLKESVIFGIIIMCFGLFLLIGIIIKIRKYLKN